MNLSTAIFLVPNAGVRSVRVIYDPENPKNNGLNRLFKTIDPAITKDDYVVVPTHTRHGFTVVKVEEVDVMVDFNGSEKWDWIVAPVSIEQYKDLLKQEEVVIQKVAKSEETRMRKQIAENLGLDDTTFAGLEIGKAPAAIADSSERGGHDTI